MPLAQLSLDKGNPLSARGFLERLLAAGPASAEVLALGMRIEMSAGDATAAERYRERLQREFPQSATARDAVRTTPPRPTGKG